MPSHSLVMMMIKLMTQAKQRTCLPGLTTLRNINAPLLQDKMGVQRLPASGRSAQDGNWQHWKIRGPFFEGLLTDPGHPDLVLGT